VQFAEMAEQEGGAPLDRRIQVRFCRFRFFLYRRLRIQGGRGRGRCELS
jgi:hypothetical protein